jgi:hypothetical protein
MYRLKKINKFSFFLSFFNTVDSPEVLGKEKRDVGRQSSCEGKYMRMEGRLPHV